MLGFAQLCDEILIKNDLFLVSGKLQTRSKNSKWVVVLDILFVSTQKLCKSLNERNEQIV